MLILGCLSDVTQEALSVRWRTSTHFRAKWGISERNEARRGNKFGKTHTHTQINTQSCGEVVQIVPKIAETHHHQQQQQQKSATVSENVELKCFMGFNIKISAGNTRNDQKKCHNTKRHRVTLCHCYGVTAPLISSLRRNVEGEIYKKKKRKTDHLSDQSP